MTRKLFVLSVVCLLTVSCTNMLHDMAKIYKDRQTDQETTGKASAPTYSPEIQVQILKNAYRINEEIEKAHMKVSLRQPDGHFKILKPEEFDLWVKDAADGKTFTEEREYTVVVMVPDGLGLVGNGDISAMYSVYAGLLPPENPDLVDLVVIPTKTTYDPGGNAIDPESHLAVYTRNKYGVMTKVDYAGGAGYDVEATGTGNDKCIFLPSAEEEQTVTVTKNGYNPKTYKVWVKPVPPSGQVTYEPELKVVPNKVGFDVGGSITATVSAGEPDLLVLKRERSGGGWTPLNYGSQYTLSAEGKLDGLTFAEGVTGQVKITVESRVSGYEAEALYTVYVGGRPPPNPRLVSLVVIPKVTVYEPVGGNINPGTDLEVYTQNEYGEMTGPVDYAGGADTGYTITIQGNAAGVLTFPSGASGTTKVVTVTKDGYTNHGTYNVWVKPAAGQVVYDPEIRVRPNKVNYNTWNDKSLSKSDVVVEKRKSDGGWEGIGITEFALSAVSGSTTLDINYTSTTADFTVAGTYTMTVTANIPGVPGNSLSVQYTAYVASPVVSITMKTPTTVHTVAGSFEPFEVDVLVNSPGYAGQVDWEIVGRTTPTPSMLLTDAATLRTVLAIGASETGQLTLRAKARGDPSKYVDTTITLDADTVDMEARVWKSPNWYYLRTLAGSISGVKNTAVMTAFSITGATFEILKDIEVPAGGIAVIPSGVSIGLYTTGTEKKLWRSEPGTAPIFTVEAGGKLILGDRDSTTILGGTLTIENLILDGGLSENINSTVPLVQVDGNLTLYNHAILKNNDDGGVAVKGTFFMNGGEICHNMIHSSSYDGKGGGVFIRSGGLFIMDGGSIYNNTATDVINNEMGGGGVMVNGGTFLMYGGDIYNNTSKMGGGVNVYYNSSFTMIGGNIYDNTATDDLGGGGVFVRSRFTMVGGEIYHNTAPRGGGVSLNSNSSVVFDKRDGNIYGSNAASDKKNTAAQSPGGNAVFLGSTSSGSGSTTTAIKYRNNTVGTTVRLYYNHDADTSDRYTDPEDTDTEGDWTD